MTLWQAPLNLPGGWSLARTERAVVSRRTRHAAGPTRTDERPETRGPAASVAVDLGRRPHWHLGRGASAGGLTVGSFRISGDGAPDDVEVAFGEARRYRSSRNFN